MIEPVADFYLVRGSEADVRMAALIGSEVELAATDPDTGRHHKVKGILKAGVIDVSNPKEVANQYLVFGRVIE